MTKKGGHFKIAYFSPSISNYKILILSNFQVSNLFNPNKETEFLTQTQIF